MNKTETTATDIPQKNTANVTETVGKAFTSVGNGVQKSIAGTMGWIRNFFFKVWGMLLLTALAMGALVVLLAFAVSILDGTTSFKRLCGNQSVLSCLSIQEDAPTKPENIEIQTIDTELPVVLPEQSSPSQRSKSIEQTSDKNEVSATNELDISQDSLSNVTE